MSETARHLAEVLSASSRGHPEAEAHLRSLGWDFVERWCSPEELAALPVCANCDERFDPEGFRSPACWGRKGQGDGGPHVAATVEP